MTTSWHAKIAEWSKLNEREAIKAIRQQVFIVEQHVPVELEWDELDSACLHLLISSANERNIATARMHIESTSAYIGRMAVLKPYRQQGIGSLMLQTLLEQAQLNAVKTVTLNAQTVAIGFYEQHGFTVTGDEFPDAGIPHYKMTKHLTDQIHE